MCAEITIESLVRPLQVGEAIGRKNAQHLLKVLKSTPHQLITPPLSDSEQRRLTRNAAFDVVSQEVSHFIHNNKSSLFFCSFFEVLHHK
jgi:U3 small nucleolar RNA-associated protein 14